LMKNRLNLRALSDPNYWIGRNGKSVNDSFCHCLMLNLG
jgi:hypothetical protein